jgi:hypothetical protein
MSTDWPPFDSKNPPQLRMPDRADLAAMHVELNRLWAVREDGRFGALHELFEDFRLFLREWPHVKHTSLLMSLGETLHGALIDACTRNHGGIPHAGTGRSSRWPKDRIVFWKDLPPALAIAPSDRCEACQRARRERGPEPVTRKPRSRARRLTLVRKNDDERGRP